jgi:adenylate cyclase
MKGLRFAEDKTIPFVRYEEVGGRYSLRYARAIVMQESCIACHVSHPDSIKKDWKVGDVRGASTSRFH